MVLQYLAAECDQFDQACSDVTGIWTFPHRWGTALAWRWGLWPPRMLQIPLFRNPKGRRLLRVPQFGPQNPAMGVLKSPGTPYRACVRRAFWRYHYLRAFSGVDTGAPGIKSDWCIYGIRAVYGCLAV